MWSMYVATWRMTDGDPDIDTEQINAETLGSLVSKCQAFMDNRDGLFIFWPDPVSSDVPLEHYADLIGADVSFGRDQTIHGHFSSWVRNGRIIVRPLYSLKRDARYRDS